ncbi:MAG: hypothetical protein R3C28_13110 [Pirellulaceae bacterium]
MHVEIDGIELGERIGEGGFAEVFRAQLSQSVPTAEVKNSRKSSALNGLATECSRVAGGCKRWRSWSTHTSPEVFDAGYANNGRPYFVMEYVDGVSLTAFCERHQFHLRDRLSSLFLQVCRAVHNTHIKKA